MLRINKIIVLLLFASCLVLLAGAGEYYSKFKYSEEEAKLYRMPIKQITPKDGIKTGHVIAYGHYIRPPYKFEIRDDTLLFVNNVQIYPKIPTKVFADEIEKTREKYRTAELLSKPYMDRFELLLILARSAYKEVALKKNRDTAIDSLYKIFKNDSLLKNILVDITIEKTGDTDVTMGIELRYPGYGGPLNLPTKIIVPFYLTPQPLRINGDKEGARNKKSLKSVMSGYIEGLKKGEVLFISSIGGKYPAPGTEPLWRVVNIMKILCSTQSYEEKYQGLKNLRLTPHQIKEFIYNFDPKEWSNLEALEKPKEAK